MRKFVLLCVIGCVLVVLLVVNGCSQEGIEGSVCEVDEDCAQIETGCCPCEMGGEEKCVNVRDEVASYSPEKCKEGLFCIAVYNCEIESCVCKRGECVPTLIEEEQ